MNKYTLETVVRLVPSFTSIGLAAAIATNGLTGWGWFLATAAITWPLGEYKYTRIRSLGICRDDRLNAVDTRTLHVISAAIAATMLISAAGYLCLNNLPGSGWFLIAGAMCS